MARKRLSMRKIRDVLRLKYSLGRSNREIGAILRISHSTVGSYVRRAREAGVSWPLPDDLDDARLEAALYPPTAPSRVRRPEPDWARVHRELARHKGVTLEAKVFVGVLAASNHTFVDVTRTRSLPDWTASHVRMFEYWGGVPELVIPDNEKAAVRRASRYEPDVNRTYHDLAVHYGTAVLPARIGLEPYQRVGRRPGPRLPDVLPELRVAAGIPRRANLREQPHGRQFRILLQPFPHDRLVRVQLGGHRRPRTVADLLEVPVLVDPAIDRLTANPPARARSPLPSDLRPGSVSEARVATIRSPGAGGAPISRWKTPSSAMLVGAAAPPGLRERPMCLK